MKNYIDGFVLILPIPRIYLDKYKKVAEKVSEIWKEYGAIPDFGASLQNVREHARDLCFFTSMVTIFRSANKGTSGRPSPHNTCAKIGTLKAIEIRQKVLFEGFTFGQLSLYLSRGQKEETADNYFLQKLL